MAGACGNRIHALKYNYSLVTNSYKESNKSLSDRIAHLSGTEQNYKILPFRGTYRKLKKGKSHLVNGNILTSYINQQAEEENVVKTGD